MECLRTAVRECGLEGALYAWAPERLWSEGHQALKAKLSPLSHGRQLAQAGAAAWTQHKQLSAPLRPARRLPHPCHPGNPYHPTSAAAQEPTYFSHAPLRYLLAWNTLAPRSYHRISSVT